MFVFLISFIRSWPIWIFILLFGWSLYSLKIFILSFKILFLFFTFLDVVIDVFFKDARESQQNEEDPGGGAKTRDVGGAEGGVEEELDSTGEEKDSPDYVDEKRLEKEETKLSQEERKVFILKCGKTVFQTNTFK